MKDYASGFYKGAAWRKTSALYLESQHYVCERCGTAACVVHHLKYITPQNIHDPEVTLNWDNLMALCMECHTREHLGTEVRLSGIAFDAAGNAIPQANVFLVCGGTWEQRRAYTRRMLSGRDLVVDDLALLSALLGGMGVPETGTLRDVLLEVQRVLHDMVRARRGCWRNAYILTPAENPMEQQALADGLNAQIVRISPDIPPISD